MTIPYYPLNPDILSLIIRLKLGKIVRRIQESHDVPLEYDEEVVNLVAARCNDVDSGAWGRGCHSDQYRAAAPGPGVSGRMLEGSPLQKVRIAVADGEFSYQFE
ncbi:MAG: hypothetical protein R3E95_23525 [Thiolinea sp.]